ncbi:hypothetical protein L0337_28645 [candidate division KSB1 bacterium]|nr:hypothetical protein [candidate division KSB1 bacterium]
MIPRMQLSEFQKLLIDLIKSGEVKDVESFLKTYCDLQITQNLQGGFHGFYGEFAHGIVVYVPKNPTLSLTHLKEFISLWRRLEKNNVIETSSKKPCTRSFFPVFKKDDTGKLIGPDDDILFALKEFNNKEIDSTSLLELEEFVKRGYTTAGNSGFSSSTLHSAGPGRAFLDFPDIPCLEKL